MEANALYDLLESSVVPTFYERNRRDVPGAWVRMMKASMKKLAPRFCTDRMVAEYVERFYLASAARFSTRRAGAHDLTPELVAWKQRVVEHWRDVRVEAIEAAGPGAVKMGQPLSIEARVALGALRPEDVDVQLYHGLLDAKEELHDAQAVSMAHAGGGDGLSVYRCEVPFRRSGRHGYTVRVIPRHPGVLIPNELTSIRWAEV